LTKLDLVFITPDPDQLIVWSLIKSKYEGFFNNLYQWSTRPLRLCDHYLKFDCAFGLFDMLKD